MSRGFVKEDDQEETPFVAPRAYLPPGAANYVTPAGLAALLDEKQKLIAEKEQLQGHNENERRVAVNHINAKLKLLEERILSARVIHPADQPQQEVRFGATVELKNLRTSQIQKLQLTGVDEAAASKGKISFLSPLARALTNKKAGDKVMLRLAKDEVVYEVLSIAYTD